MPKKYAIEYSSKPKLQNVTQQDEKKNSSPKNDIKPVIIYSSPFCGFCTKLKKELKNNNLLDKVTIIEDESMFPEYVKSMPYTIQTDTNKKYIGFPSNFNNYKNMFF